KQFNLIATIPGDGLTARRPFGRRFRTFQAAANDSMCNRRHNTAPRAANGRLPLPYVNQGNHPMQRRAFLKALGGAAGWPLAARAQQPAMPVVGFLSFRSAADSLGALEPFRKGLAEVGYIEGRNVAVDYRWADPTYDPRRNRLIALSAQHAVPTLYHFRDFP